MNVGVVERDSFVFLLKTLLRQFQVSALNKDQKSTIQLDHLPLPDVKWNPENLDRMRKIIQIQRADFYLFIVMDVLPFVGRELSERRRPEFSDLLESIQRQIEERKTVFTDGTNDKFGADPLLSTFKEQSSSDLLTDKWERIVANGSDLFDGRWMEAERFILRPHRDLQSYLGSISESLSFPPLKNFFLTLPYDSPESFLFDSSISLSTKRYQNCFLRFRAAPFSIFSKQDQSEDSLKSIDYNILQQYFLV